MSRVVLQINVVKDLKKLKIYKVKDLKNLIKSYDTDKTVSVIESGVRLSKAVVKQFKLI